MLLTWKPGLHPWVGFDLVEVEQFFLLSQLYVSHVYQNQILCKTPSTSLAELWYSAATSFRRSCGRRLINIEVTVGTYVKQPGNEPQIIFGNTYELVSFRYKCSRRAHYTEGIGNHDPETFSGMQPHKVSMVQVWRQAGRLPSTTKYGACTLVADTNSWAFGRTLTNVIFHKESRKGVV